MKKKLVYVLPTYDTDSPEHTFHIYGFLEAVARHLDVLLIIERTRGEPGFHNLRVYQRHTHFPLLRALEVLIVMLWARLHGYRRFYVHYSMSGGILSALVTRILGGVSYYWSCGYMMDFVPEHVRSWSDLRSKLRNHFLLRLTLHMVHHLVTCTATMARYYSENYDLPASDIRIMPNWVDLKRFHGLPEKSTLRLDLGWPVGRKVVLFLHRLAERKGAHYIVPIAREVLTHYADLGSDLLFVVVGDGPYRAKLEKEIQEAGLEEHFRLVGPVPNREAVKYFAAADVYMMPSTKEAFGRVQLEAMAAGCPLTVMDAGGARDILTLKQRRFMVPGEDWRAMAATLGRLLTDPGLREELARHGLAHVHNYSQGRVVQMFVSLISE